MHKRLILILVVSLTFAAALAGWTWDCRGQDAINDQAIPVQIDGPSDGADI